MIVKAGVMKEREGAAKRKEELPPEDSVLIRLLLHLLIASHWGCREISVACHYACRSDFSFTQLACICTIRPVCVCAWCVLSNSSLLFLSFPLSCTLQWKAVKVIGEVRVVYKLIKMSCYWLSDMSIRCARECVCVRMELCFSLCSAHLMCFMSAGEVRWQGYIFPLV